VLNKLLKDELQLQNNSQDPFSTRAR
jgi:hypothetical protein